jgi:multiple sugar transport system permease protein
LGKYKTLSGNYTFIGFENYAKVFSDDDFWNALSNTAIFTFGTVPITAILSLILAVLIDKASPKLKVFLQGAYFLPSVTSLVVISLIFTALYQKGGYVALLLELIGLPYPENGFLLSPDTALFSVMAMEIWISTGYYTLLFLAALQTIPSELYESAKLMGAGNRTQFLRITLPLVKPTMLFVLVINTIKSFQVFVEIYVMTKGGPVGSTTTLVYEVFEKGFNQMDKVGYASAMAYILFLILAVLSFAQFKLLKNQ